MNVKLGVMATNMASAVSIIAPTVKVGALK
jgi:hypothetical protein